MAARTGYYDMQRGKANSVGTRVFLSHVIPVLISLKPLIDAGIIVLVPSKEFIYANQSRIQTITNEITAAVSVDTEGFIKRFGSRDLAVEDNVRGMFIFAGGDREEQIRQQIKSSVYYFISEYLLARMHGFNYTAPFEYEAFLCKEGLENSLSKMPGAKVLHAIFNSELPLYSGLTPEIIAKIRDDDNYAGFRAELYQIYSGIPEGLNQEELEKYIAEQEGALLRPILQKAENEVKTGTISKLGIGLLSSGFKIFGSVLTGSALLPSNPNMSAGVIAGAAAINELFNVVGDSMKKDKVDQGTTQIWSRLYNHNKNYQTEVTGVRLQEGKNIEETKELWGIPKEPSPNVFITEGALVWDSIPTNLPEGYSSDWPLENVYGPCPCLSGRKFKFCCKGLDKIKVKQL